MVTVFLPSIDLEKFYGQLIKKFEMEGVSGNPGNPPKIAPEACNIIVDINLQVHFDAFL